MALEGLSALNPRPTKLPGPGLLHHLVAAASDSAAIEYLSNHRETTSYSYDHLHRRASALAARLSLARGNAQGRFVVPVLVRQSPELYIALLAVLKAGGAFCPLNPDDPPERISFILKDISASVLLVSRDLPQRVPCHDGVQLVHPDTQDAASDLEHVQHPIPASHDLAYVMYTSGSTGVPKGVGISHSAACQALLAHDRHIPLFSRFFQFAAPTFDISVFEIFFTFYRASTLICVDRDELLNDLPGVLMEMRVDACELTPTVAAGLLRARDHAPNLKLLMTIGEMLSEPVVREFGSNGDRDSILWAMYGPTEATIHCTVQPRFSSAGSIHDIGRPLDTVSCFVIQPVEEASGPSDVFQILPRGQVGELALGGHQLAAGYLNRPEQNSAAFISSPYGRIYRTGDKARINTDGTLDCLGRLSQGQVKLRGQRLELGEVEASILRTPGCYGAVATILDSVLIAFCAVDAGVSEKVILRHCERWLPKFMVPQAIVLLKQLPRLSSGKVDKRRLESDYRAANFASDPHHVEPSLGILDRGPQIMRVISKILNVEVSKPTMLAQAGLDSLRAIVLAAALRAAGFQTSAAHLLLLKTASDVCSALLLTTSSLEEKTDCLSKLKDLDEIIAENPALGRVRHLIEDILPCHPLQTSMLHETSKHHEMYWNEIALEVDAGVSVDKLSNAILRIIAQNEVLRSGFVPVRDGFASIIFETFDEDRMEFGESFHRLDVAGLDEVLHPLRLQILDREAQGLGPKILIHIHHAIYDGWSMDLFLSDLSEILKGAMVPPRKQYRRFIQYFSELPTKQSDDDRAFWSDYLLDWNQQPLPSLCNRPADCDDIKTFEETFHVSTGLVNKATMETGCSVHVYFQAAVAIVLGGMIGGSDVVIGSVLSGRSLPIRGIDGLIGPCIASHPLRIDLAQAATVLDLLLGIKESNRNITEHISLPLSEIKRLVRGQTIDVLYDVLFVYQKSILSEKRGQLLVKETRHLDRLEAKLLIEAEPHDGGGFKLLATYHSATISTEAVHQMLAQVKEVFLHLLGHENFPLSSITQAIHARRSIYNEAPRITTDQSDLALLFEASVTRTPHSDALSFKTSSFTASPGSTATMSFDTLNRVSNKIAHLLLNQGAVSGEVIAIIMEKSPLLYASILGITKARCAYLPLLPSTPISRVRRIMLIGGIKTCVVDRTSIPSFLSIDTVKFLDLDSTNLEGLPDQNLDIAADGSRLAYVICTSGTTGVPKGVAVTQRNMVSNLRHLGSVYPTSERNPPRLLQACSHAFDVSVFEIFFAWHMGMCLCAASNDVLFEDMERVIREFRITHLSLTPSVASLLQPRNVPDVEFLVTAGEPLTASVLERWGDLLWQGYGPSETTNICSVKRMKRGEYINHLGWVFPNTSVVVLKPGSLEVMPLNWVGEFCFGGDQVAAGYLNKPELTVEVFIDHPSLGRIYRSGDMGRMLADGTLAILGRIDDQIKLRGQRIEASEVNGIITGTSLADAAVTITVTSGNAPESAQLASFYVEDRKDGEFKVLEIDAKVHQSLFASLMSWLPSYMVPSYLIPISHLPLTTNGKIDTQRLQSCFTSLSQEFLELSSRIAENQDDSEWTEIESSIACALSRSLDIPRSKIGRWTAFAKLGLHSISAIGVARDLKSLLGLRIPISALLQNSTVAQLSNFIAKSTHDVPREVSEESQYFSQSFVEYMRQEFLRAGQPGVKIYPCSPLQEAMLFHDQGAYYNKITLRLRIGPEKMKQCWVEMVQRHDILRTCFMTTNNPRYPIAQVLLESLILPWKDWSTETHSLAGAIRKHRSTIPEALESKAPPFSLALIQVQGDMFLSFICHHALYDGVAMDTLLREVEVIASAESLPPPVSYYPFLQEMLNLPQDVAQFWVVHFWGISSAELFAEPSRGRPVQNLHSTALGFAYDEVEDKAQLLGASLLSVCQAAWAQVLSIGSGRADVCFGCVMSGRALDIDGLERLVAPCFNTVPVRMDTSRHSSNVHLTKAFQLLNADMLQYQFTPLRMLQNKIMNTDGGKLFDTLLILQMPSRVMDERIWTLEEDSGEMEIPLVCEVIPSPSLNTLNINLHYHSNVIDERLVIAFGNAFKHFFHSILKSPSAPVAERNGLPADISPSPEKLARRGNRVLRSIVRSRSQDDERWTASELIVREVLLDLSGVPARKILRDTSLFRLGLDSINAPQIAWTLRRQGFTVSASDVIEYHSCRMLGERLLRADKPDIPRPEHDFSEFSDKVMPQIKEKLSTDSEVEVVNPCTPIQCAMLASFLQSNGQYYLNMTSYALDKDVSRDCLINSWNTLQRGHPMLCTGFVPIHHSDSSFAMIRYRNASEKGYRSESIQVLDQNQDIAQWKATVKSQILEALHIPPWRLAISESSSGLSMHLLIHHALYDATSLDSILAGLAELLREKPLRNYPAVEPALRHILSHGIGVQSKAREYWEEKAESVVVNNFPVMTSLRENQRQIRYHDTVSSLSFSDLQSHTQRQGVSIQAVIQSAWTRVLSSYLGEESVVFGVIFSGRSSDETKDSPLPCAVTVPIIATHLQSNKEMVDAMIEFNRWLHKHQFVSLGRVQHWLGHPATRIFDTLLVYQKIERDVTLARPWRCLQDDATVDYPVSIEVEPRDDDSIRLGITYFNDILPLEQARLLLRQFDAVMHHIVMEPTGHEDELYHLHRDLFAITPAAMSVIPAPVRFLHEFVEQKALSSPDDPALEFVARFDGGRPATQVWTYAEFNAMGNRVANMLEREASVGSIIAIHFEKCPEAYISILGILKAGCSFVALDVGSPKPRKEFIVKDSQASCLLISSHASLDVEPTCNLIRISLEDLGTFSSDPRKLGPDLVPNSTCYCLYTSGTTGTPKGCEISHENCVQAMMAFQDLFRGHWQSDSRWLQFAAFHFDVSVLEQYWSWSVGITVVAAPRELILDDLIESINKLGITHIDLTPSLARLTHPHEVPGLCKGVFITGGESLKQEILDAWGHKAVIYNAYGPTEATIGVTMYQRVPVNGRPSNIGKQFLNVGSYVFRKGTENPVLRGSVGELCVSGKLVGKGYLNRPELTEERFPTLSAFGERVYRTGDLVRILHDGCFDFLGRADDQVKLRGQRLEIGEINHVIRSETPEIADVATLVMRRQEKDRHKDVLVSFIVGRDEARKGAKLQVLPQGQGKLVDRARAACRARLPSYMVPTYFLVLPFIPLSPNNKVEAKELKKLFDELSPEQLLALTVATSSVRQVDTRMLKLVVGILADFCQVGENTITESTSIFDLGVDSILALQLSTFFKKQGLESCSPALLLRNPILADLCLAFKKNDKSGKMLSMVRDSKQTIRASHHRHLALVCGALGMQPKDVEHIAPCSALQQGIISKSVTSHVPGLYFNTFKLELRESISVERLKAAWSEVVAREAILRTCFVETSDGYVQVAWKVEDTDHYWRTCEIDSADDLERWTEEAQQRWIERNLGTETFSTPFEIVLVSGPGSTKTLLIHLFHAIYDGNSFDAMMRLVEDAYRYPEQETRRGPSFLEALCHGPLWRYDESRNFWVEHLRHWRPTPVSRLSTSQKQTDSPVQVEKVISGTSLEAVRQKYNVTLQSVVMALWTVVLQQALGSGNGITIGIIVSGRSIDLPNVENTIGPLFNTLPFFFGSSSGQDWESVVRKCHDFHISILPFQHVPLKSIQKWCSRGRPLFDNVFVYATELNGPESETELWTVKDGPLNPDYPLALEVKRLKSGDLRFCLVSQGHIADAEDLMDLLQQVERSAELMATGELLQPNNKGEKDKPNLPDECADAVSAVNGLQEKDHPFVWSDEALIMRKTIAIVAHVEEEDITATRTMLELGLDSVDVIQLSAKLRSQGVNLSASTIMRQQSISRMMSEAEIQTQLSHSEPTSECMANESLEELKRKLWEYVEGTRLIEMRGVDDILPPTHLQESLVAAMLHSDFAWYFNHDLLEMAANTDIQRMRDAWVHLFRASPILRTGFLAVDEPQLDLGYCQVIYSQGPVVFEELEIESLSEISAVIQRATEYAKEGRGANRLFQVKHVKCQARHFFLVSMAHALYDGWSLGLMHRALEAAYRGEFTPASSSHTFLQKLLASQTEDDARYWAGYLSGASGALIPDLDQGASLSNVIHRMEAVSEHALEEIFKFCRKQNVSLQTLVQACWAAVLAHRVRSLDVIFGVVLSGRDFEGAEDLMFPTMNTVPFRCILHGTTSEFLAYMETIMMDVRDHQSYPLRRMRAANETHSSDLFNTLFILQRNVSGERSSEPLLTSVDGSSAVDYPVCVEAEATKHGVVWRVACQAPYLSEAESAQLVCDLDTVLGFIMGSGPSALLAFQGESVSICGLSPVELTSAQVNEAPPVQAIETDPQTWTEVEVAIREGLSLIADIPVELIPAQISLYHLGLDSISALKVCAFLKKKGYHVNPRHLLKAKSLAEMGDATHRDEQNGSDSVSEYPAWKTPDDSGLDRDKVLAQFGIAQHDVEFILPALPMQVYMISAWLNSHGSVFFPEFQYLIEGPKDEVHSEALELAWKTLVAELPILRTLILATHSKTIPFLQVALKGASEALREGTVKPLVHFHTSEATCGRHGVLVRLGIHHALYDGVSLPAMMRRLMDILQAQNQAATTKVHVAQWSGFAIQPTEEHAREARKAFWVEYLKDALPSSISDDGVTRGIRDESRVECFKKAALEDLSTVRHLTSEHGVSIQSLFLAAYAKVLIARRISHGAQTVVFGIYLANRLGTQALPPLFPTLNLVPLKVAASCKDDALVDVALAIQEDIHAITSEDRERVGLWEIADWTGITIDSFVNFLGGVEKFQDSSIKATILEQKDHEGHAYSKQAWGQMAGHNLVGGCFPSALDVEASVRDDALDIGVFGAAARISHNDAAALVEEILEILKSASP